MGRKAVKQSDIQTERTLNDEDWKYCSAIASMIEWPVKMETMQVCVPQSEIEEAMQDDIVRTLCDQFNFSLQATIV